MPEVRESILDGGDTPAEPLELPAAAASSDWRGLAMAVCNGYDSNSTRE